MQPIPFPVIDLAATGENIARLRRRRGLSVREVQAYFGFAEPQAVYKWQRGESLPSVDNLYALSALLEVPMEEILVSSQKVKIAAFERQDEPCRSVYFVRPAAIRQESARFSTHFAGRVPA